MLNLNTNDGATTDVEVRNMESTLSVFHPYAAGLDVIKIL